MYTMPNISLLINSAPSSENWYPVFILLEKRSEESECFQETDWASMQYSKNNSGQAHPHAHNVQSIFKWPA